MINGGILHHPHLSGTVKDKRVILLVHEEMLHLPTRLRHFLFKFAITVNGQREDDALTLQLTVGCKIKYEIVKQLVRCLGHRCRLYQILRRIDAGSIWNQ